MNIGIIGAGAIAKVMARTLNAMEEATCYAIASRSYEKAEQFAAEFGVEQAYGSYEELVQDPKVDLIYIATPHSHHYEHAKLCIEHGKAVLCEKAFMANAIQAKEIYQMAEEKGVFITEAMWTRFLPARRMVEEIIQSGEIGEVTFASANLGCDIKDVERIQRPELAGGALLDIGIYPLTFISMFLGNDVKEMVSTCTKTETGVDAQDAIILKYDHGVVATAHCGIYSGTDQTGSIYGTEGYLVVEHVNNMTVIKVYNRRRQLIREVKAPEQITGYEYEVRAAIQAIQDGKLECTEISHKESVMMMELMDNLRKDWGIRYPFEL